MFEKKKIKIKLKSTIVLVKLTELKKLYKRKQKFLKKFKRVLTRKKAPSNKIPAIAKSMNMDILIVGTSK